MNRVNTDDEIKGACAIRARRMTLTEFHNSLTHEEYNAITRFFGFVNEFWQKAQEVECPSTP